jgi:Carboxypeptidase regulatory-like domain
MIRKFTQLLLSLCVANLFIFNSLHAQITSASLSGFVIDDSSKAVPGAIVRAVHVPSGTTYGTATENNGSFNIKNMRVGGPYKVTVAFTGMVAQEYDNVYLALGETYQLTIRVAPNETELKGVTINAARDNIFNNEHTGVETIINANEIATLPSISRSIFDYTSLTPQSDGSSFEGRDSRYNNFQLNGANFNNSFGLSSGLPGGNQPFPLDAVEQIQVALSPYDVKQSYFTGANVNMVTRSGTNTFNGSAYTYWRNETYEGDHVGSVSLPPQTVNRNNTYGVRFSGPIIKNKLFFFVNGEYEKNIHPGISPSWVASDSAGQKGPNISFTPADSLQKVSDFVKNKYNYNTGAYDNYANNFTNTYLRTLARIDYNINEKNKIDFTFTAFSGKSDQTPNSSSAAGGSLSNGRIGQNSLSYANSDYAFKDVVTSGSLEWLSTFSKTVSNQLVAAYTHVRDTRTSPSAYFPFIDIDNENANTNYISLGEELFSYKNDVKYNTTYLYDNLTINKGINNITAGASLEYLTFANSYLPYGTSYYHFSSITNFISGQSPTVFGYTYPYAGSDGYAKASYGLASLYAEDKISITKNFVVTGGLRLELPFYPTNLTSNPYIDTLRLLNPSGDTTHYNASKWPTSQLLASPRISFNWRPLKNGRLQVRGGTGIFTGQIPFVWFTNQPGNSGTISNNVQITSASILSYMKFEPTPQQALALLPDSLRNALFPTKAGSSVPGLVALVAPHFKMPQVWRSSLSADYKLPVLNLVGTVELQYTKDLQSVYQFNANLPKPSGVIIDSFGNNRPYYKYNRIYSNVSGVYVLSNSTLGDAYSATVGIRRPTQKGFYGSVFYTRMYSEDIGPNGGSQAGSAWTNTPGLQSPNHLALAPSGFYNPDHIVGTISYRYEWLKHFASTLSLVYTGYSGSRFSYNYNQDINNDGGKFNDLIYIPKNASDLHWFGFTQNGVTFTPQQEIDAFNAYMNQDKYLNSHRGQYAQRNGAQYPYYGRFNARFLQDVYLTTKNGTRHTLEFSVDVLNLDNMLNRKWGIAKTLTVPYAELLQPHYGPGYIKGYQLVAVKNDQGQTVLPTSTFTNSVTTGSVWQMQLGLRYSF